MRYGNLSIRILAVSVGLALAICMVGCAEESPAATSQVPAASSDSLASGAGDESDNSESLTYEERLYQALYKNAKHPINEQSGWIRKDDQIFVAIVSTNGRLFKGEWKTYDEAANFSVEEDVYDYYMRKEGYCYATFFAVPDDTNEGTNCSWDGTSLKYYPPNVNDTGTYMRINGFRYRCHISPSGYLYDGTWTQDTKEGPNYIYFESFPYSSDRTVYHWNGSKLENSVVHVVADADIMTYAEIERYENGRELSKEDGKMAMPVNVDSTGRIQKNIFAWVRYEGTFEEEKEFYAQHGYNECFSAIPVYGSMTDFIWDGTSFIYSPIKN